MGRARRPPLAPLCEEKCEEARWQRPPKRLCGNGKGDFPERDFAENFGDFAETGKGTLRKIKRGLCGNRGDFAEKNNGDFAENVI